MAKEKPTASNVCYFGTNDGMFTESYKVTSETPGAEKIIVTNPSDNSSKEKWVVKYRSLTGYFTGISWSYEDRISSDQLKIEMYDPDEKETSIIQVGFNTGYARDFIKRLPNVDFSKEVKLTCFQSEREDKPGKYNTGISIRNREGLDWTKDPIKAHWTKANPHDAPQLTDQGVDGDFDVWRVKFSKFLKSFLETKVSDKIVDDAWIVNKPSAPTSDIAPPDSSDAPMDLEDDLPF